MSAPRRLRRLVGWATYAILILGLLQEGAGWAASAWLGRWLGTRPPIRVHLLTLDISSPEGSGLFRGVGVRWSGVRVDLWGRLSAEGAELGPVKAPLLSLKDLRLGDLWGLPTGGVARIAVRPFAAGWASLGQGAGSPQGWILNVPLDLQVGDLRIESPAGPWQGSGWVGGGRGGGEGTWAARLSGATGVLDLSGSWSPKGGSADLLFRGGGKTLAIGRCGWTSDQISTDLEGWPNGQSWGVEGRVVRGGNAQFALWNPGSLEGGGVACAELAPGGAPGSPGSLIRYLAGELRLASPMVKGIGRIQAPILTLHYHPTLHEAGHPSTCISASLRGLWSDSRGGAPRPLRANVDWLGTEGKAWSLGFSADTGMAGNAPPSGAPRLAGWLAPGTGGHPVGSLTLRWGKLGADFRSTFTSGRLRLSGSLRGPSGSMDVQGEARGKAWTLRGKGAWRGTGGAWPMPAGGLVVNLSASGEGAALRTLDLDAKGGGAWRFRSQEGIWTADVSDGQLRGSKLSLEGLQVKVAGEGGRWHGTLKVAHAEAWGKELKDLALSGSGKGGRADADFSAGLPFLEGQARGSLHMEDIGGAARAGVSQANLSLFGGQLVIKGLDAPFTPLAARQGDWRCEGISLRSEQLGAAKGAWKIDPASSGYGLQAAGNHWGGPWQAAVESAAGSAPRVSIRLKDVEAKPMADFLRATVPLPFSVAGGRADVEGGADLGESPPAIKGRLTVRDSTLQFGSADRTLRKLSGLVLIDDGKSGLALRTEGASLEGGKLPVKAEAQSSGGGLRLEFSVPRIDAAELQNAFFDFLPEYLGYGTVEGQGAVSGSLDFTGGQPVLRCDLALNGASFLSEDKSLKVAGMEGRLPLEILLGKDTHAIPGFQQRGSADFGEGARALGLPLPEGEALHIRRVRYSVFHADDLELSSSTRQGLMDLRATKGKLWDGDLQGEARLSLSEAGIRYAGQILLDQASLKAFCSQSGSLAGDLSGDLDGSLTFGGEGLGLSRVRALGDLWVDPRGSEPMLIGRDFLVRIGGERIRSLTHSATLPYDQASLRCGLDGGELSFYRLVLLHEANPLKAILRQDFSYEVRIPQGNTISIWQLINHIKALEASAPETKIQGPAAGP